MNIGYSRKCDNVKAIVWHRSFNSAIIFPLYATIDHLTLSSLLSPVSWSRNNADRDKTDVVVRPWWPIRKLELLSRTKHAWLLNPVAMVNKGGRGYVRTMQRDQEPRNRLLSYRLKRPQPCREDCHSQPISIITTLVSILQMYCFHAKDIITAFCFYPLEGRLDRPKFSANTQSLLSLHAAWRVVKTVNKKDSLS